MGVRDDETNHYCLKGFRRINFSDNYNTYVLYKF